MTAMTPNTQSVCKHCLHEIERSMCGEQFPWQTTEFDGASVTCPGNSSLNQYHEPVAEPASTGEPPHAHEIENDGNGSIYCIICGYWFVDGKWAAARPSEPSANFMQKIGGTCLKHGEYNGQQCPKWPDCISAAAPQTSAVVEYKNRFGVMAPDCTFGCNESQYDQRCNIHRPAVRPVSGDAPKVEEVARKLHLYHCQERRSGSICPCHVIAEGMSEGCHCKEETADIAAILRPYFPPASQTPENVQMACLEIASKMSSDVTLIQRDAEWIAKVLRKHVATPASTARTDAELQTLWAALKPHVWERKYDTGRDIETEFELAVMRLGKHIEKPAAPGSVPQAPKPPKIICLCGSTRFIDTWIEQYQRLSDAGSIVLTVARMPPRPNLQNDEPDLKARLDTLHLRKIDLSDEILVLNVGGYIGESTRREIEYAAKIGKKINYLEAGVPQAEPPKWVAGNHVWQKDGSCFGCLTMRTEENKSHKCPHPYIPAGAAQPGDAPQKEQP